MGGLSGGGFQERDGGLGIGDERIGVGHIEIAGEAGAAAILGDLRALLLGGQVAARD